MHTSCQARRRSQTVCSRTEQQRLSRAWLRAPIALNGRTLDTRRRTQWTLCSNKRAHHCCVRPGVSQARYGSWHAGSMLPRASLRGGWTHNLPVNSSRLINLTLGYGLHFPENEVKYASRDSISQRNLVSQLWPILGHSSLVALKNFGF